jgi:hypothetical protein
MTERDREPRTWIPLESNPDVLNEFSSKLGLSSSAPDASYQFCDVFGLDADLLAMVPQPVLAVLLLFPITEATEIARKEREWLGLHATRISCWTPSTRMRTHTSTCTCMHTHCYTCVLPTEQQLLEREGVVVEGPSAPFYMHQTISNACGSIGEEGGEGMH